MIQILLLVVLLFVPVNVTPYIAVWVYEKILFLAEPVLSIIEALQVVLFINYISQSLVDEIEESATVIKVPVMFMLLILDFSFVHSSVLEHIHPFIHFFVVLPSFIHHHKRLF